MDTKAAVLFISGQSNAHAHGQRLAEEDRITVPLKNVFALDREPNQSLSIQDVIWSGHTNASLPVARGYEKALYETGKYLLSAYGLFEEG